MKAVAFVLLGAALWPDPALGQRRTTLTDSLVHAFHAAWNANDLDGMVDMLQPDAFFKSPFQLRSGRETMAATVLRRNPPVISDCVTKEMHSRVDGDMAWSIGELYCSRYFRESGRVRRKIVRIEDGDYVFNAYDEEGRFLETGRHPATDYAYVFTRRRGGDWKVQMLIYHENG